MKILAIIPARYASTRFPGKPLVLIHGKPMIQHVVERVSSIISDVFVATDDDRIKNKVIEFGAKVIMTSTEHKSGTDRCSEAAEKASQIMNTTYDIVLNIQGDEPFIEKSQIESLINLFDDEVQIATLVKPITSFDELVNPNSPKVVINKNNEALYFSRSTIPYNRGYELNQWMNNHTYFKHIGIYAFKYDVLTKITQIEQSKLELVESLEQLRWIENGYRIKVGFTTIENIAIDTPEDLLKLN